MSVDRDIDLVGAVRSAIDRLNAAGVKVTSMAVDDRTLDAIQRHPESIECGDLLRGFFIHGYSDESDIVLVTRKEGM